MLKPICVKCGRFYRPFTNGIGVKEQKPAVYGAEPGVENAKLWEDYKIWHADLWRCLGCGHLLVVGSGMQAISEHYMERFKDALARFKQIITVYDC